MSKKMYIGVDGTARQVKKAYIGVDGTARRIKKAYIGIGGVAKPFFSSYTKIELYQSRSDLSEGRAELAAASVGNYALFAGGHLGDHISSGARDADIVDAFNSSLVKNNNVESLDVGRYSLAATSVGGYAFFGGGLGDAYAPFIVDVYNSSLSRTNPTTLYKSKIAAASVGKYALFAGGDITVEGYDSSSPSLTKIGADSLSQARTNLAATSIKEYAFFAGGYSSGTTSSNIVDAYNSSLTRSDAEPLLNSRAYLAATSVGDFALFGGGGNLNDVDAYNSSLTRISADSLSKERRKLAATSVGDFALFGGGQYYDYNRQDYKISSVLDIYDSSLTRIDTKILGGEAIPHNAYDLAATTVGDFALFGGGNDGYYGKSDQLSAYKLC